MIEFASLMAEVAQRLLGAPNKQHSTQAEWRYGTNGSLRVSVEGPHAGTWRSHEEQVGGGVLDLICFREGCDKHAALEWLKQQFPDVVEDRPQQQPARSRVVARYAYVDERGDLMFEVERLEPKSFRQCRPDGNGGRLYNLKGVRAVPYRLPDVIEAIALGKPVYVVEGEKDADNLAAQGLTATCNAGGARKWRDEFAGIFEGARVIVLPDNDEPGAEHAEMVARSLRNVAQSVKVLQLAGLPRKGDVSDWLAAGGTGAQLQDMAEAAPEWRAQRIGRLPAVWFGDEDREPPLSWLVKGVLVDGGLSAVFGAPGSSKTFLVLDMALSIAHGFEFFGHKVMQGGVVYVSGEGGSGMRQRMKAWRNLKGDRERAPFVMVPASVNLFDNDDGVSDLIGEVAAHAQTMGHPVRLVVLDTLSRMIGSGDEDRAHDVNVIVQKAERIQRETGAHVLVVHHSGKDRDRGMRGSNALLGAVDAAIEVTRHESGLCEAKITKVKDGGAADPFRYLLAQSILGQDEDGEDITSCVVSAQDASPSEPEGKRKPTLGDRERIALEALREAVIALGQDGKGGSVPTSVRTVTVEQWREFAYRRGLSASDEADAKRKAFQRVREKLHAKGIIGAWDDLIWEA